MVYDDIPAQLPRDYYYALNKLSGSVSKNVIKVQADRSSASPGNITQFRLPISAMVSLKSLAIFWEATLTGTNPTQFGRYSSSFIKRLSISMNGVTISQIDDYNLLYNLMADHNNKNKTKGIGGEFLDNSITWGEGSITGSDQSAITGTDSLLAAATNPNGVKMCVNNFLGFLGSTSTDILPLDRVGECIINIQWAQPYEVCGGTAEASSATYSNNSYSLDKLYLTCECFSFSDDSYYNSIGNKDLQIGFNDYLVTKFATTTKTSGINCTTYLSANSIDWIAGTAIQPQTAVSTMVAYGGGGDGASANVINQYEYLSNPKTYVNNNGSAKQGDGFFNVKANMRDLQGLESSQFSINNKQLNYGSFDKHEVFQNNLAVLGYENVDASNNGLIDTCVSIFHYFKYYGACFNSLSLVEKEGFYLSGLSSAGSSCAVNFTAKFSGNATYDIVPVIIAKMSKVLHIKAGRMISTE